MVQLECRFLRYAVEGDGGLGTRFTAEAPLRLAVNFSAGQLDLVTADDRSALGDPKQDMPSHPAIAVVVFERGAAPIFTGESQGLRLMIFLQRPRLMFLQPPSGPLLWSRDEDVTLSRKPCQRSNASSHSTIRRARLVWYSGGSKSATTIERKPVHCRM